MKALPALLFFFLLPAFIQRANSQSTSATQFSSELRFARTLAKRWSGEVTFTNNWIQSPPADGLFDQYGEWSIGSWGHYYIAAKWRISLGASIYHKLELEDPQQHKSNEIRFSGQGTYYIKKIGYTISARSRLEWRNVQDAEQHFQSVLRLREQLKIVVPINAKSIREGIIYGFGSDELFFKTPSDATGDEIFDRNRFEIGMGYAITNDVTVELYYTNVFLPRDTDQVNSVFNLDFSFRNLVENMKKRFSQTRVPVPDD